MRVLYYELKLASTILRNRTGFVVTIMLTLGLTLGALITMFNLNYVLLMKPLPYPNQDRLMVTDTDRIKGDSHYSSFSHTLPGLLHTYRNQNSFEKMAIYGSRRAFLNSHTEQPSLFVTSTTPEYFELLGVPMKLGRAFSQNEGIGNKEAVMVLSHDTWLKWFNGAKNVIGDKVQLGETVFTVIGVVDEKFVEPEIGRTSELWIPWEFHGYNDAQLANWGNFKKSIGGFGLIKQGMSIIEARETIKSLVNEPYSEIAPNVRGYDKLQTKLIPMKQMLLGDSSQSAFILTAAALVLLLIACANIINMFYSRAAEKLRTFAIQSAMGGRRIQIFMSMFAESLIITSLASVVGLLLAILGLDLLKIAGKGLFNRLDELGLESTTFVFAFVIAVTLATIFAYLSCIRINYSALKEHLQSGSKGSGIQISKFTRNILVISQVSLATLMLAISSVVLDKSYGIINHPLGFDPTGIVSLEIVAAQGKLLDRSSRNLFIAEVSEAVKELKSVDAVTHSFTPPLNTRRTVVLEDKERQGLGGHMVNYVAANFFETIGLELANGRQFSITEVREGANVALISEATSKRIAGNKSPLGMFLFGIGENPIQVIGVVKDIYEAGRYDFMQGRDVYLPFYPENLHLLIKLNEDLANAKIDLVNKIKQIDSSVQIASLSSIEEFQQRRIKKDKITSSVAASLALLALILAAIGIYGVLSYSSQMRRYELGIRMAHGAKQKQIIKLVITENMYPVVIGLIISVVIAILLYSFGRQSVEYMVDVKVLPMLFSFPIILITSLVSSYFPIRKLVKDDPIKALKNE